MAHAFDLAGHTINQVISPNIENAKILAQKFGAYYGSKASEMYKDSDFVMLCVSDDAYADAMADLPGGMNAIVCHTAGPVSIDVLASYGAEYGVIYPLQSLRKEEVKDLMQVPIFIEWSSDAAKNKIADLANSISNKVREVTSSERAKYHLAAVFANNFTNAMYMMAHEYLGKEGLDFKNLHPIIQETAMRLKSGKPADWQTGPAKRGDKEVIDRHLDMLPAGDAKAVYEVISDYLMKK